MKVGISDILKMRSVIFESSVSLDGFIEGPNGELDWLVYDDSEIFDVQAFLASFDTIFFGRKTYDRMGFPELVDRDLTEAEKEFYYLLHGMRKYVFSRTEKHVRGNGMVVSENIAEEVRRIRDEEGKNIWFFGGADILKTFAELDLIDEYVLTVHPVLLSSGKPLFAGNRKPLNLRLVAKRDLKSGVVILHYKPETRLNGSLYGSRSF
jgi:dihydrofolate reductase